MSPQADKAPAHFKTMAQANVPQGRHGKHNRMVSTILRDLDLLKDGFRHQNPLGGFSGKQGKGPFSLESCHA